MKPIIKKIFYKIPSIAAISALLLIILHTNQNARLSILESSTEETSFFRKNNNSFKFEENEQYPCIHEQILEQESKLEKPDSFYDGEEFKQTIYEEGEVSGSSTSDFKPIRIHFDFSNLSDTTQEVQNFIKHDLIPAAGQFFTEFLKVQPLQSKLQIDPYYKYHKCGAAQIVIPKNHIENGISDTDIVFYISASEDTKNKFLAYASNCHQSKRYTLSSKRPTIGYFNMNLFYLQKHLEEKDPIRKSQWIWTTIHEMTHSLVFSPFHFQNFVKDTNPTVFDNDIEYFNTPTVVKLVREHFNCNTAIGAPLEDEGGMGTAGAHWERKIFGNELMTGSAMYDSVISKFTAAVFESSGWYTTNLEETSLLAWGKNRGCEIFKKQCDNHQFCQKSKQVFCSYDYAGLASCQKDVLSDQCQYFMSYSNTHCNNPRPDIVKTLTKLSGSVGPHSRCWKNDVVRKKYYKNLDANCFESRCTYDNEENPIASFRYNDNWYNCKKSGDLISTDEGFTFECPNLYSFCYSLSSCPDSCSARGVCKRGKCICADGFSGDNCSISHH